MTLMCLHTGLWVSHLAPHGSQVLIQQRLKCQPSHILVWRIQGHVLLAEFIFFVDQGWRSSFSCWLPPAGQSPFLPFHPHSFLHALIPQGTLSPCSASNISFSSAISQRKLSTFKGAHEIRYSPSGKSPYKVNCVTGHNHGTISPDSHSPGD